MSTEDTTTYQYYPSITNLMDLSYLPDFLSFLKEGIEDVFKNKVFYSDYQSSINADSNRALYSLNLVFKEKLSLEIAGTGMYLSLNPGYSDSTITEIPISIFWEWKILKYVRGFSLNSFSYEPAAFFDVALSIFGISEEQMLLFIMNKFVFTDDSSTSGDDGEGVFDNVDDPSNNTIFQELLSVINTLYGTNISIDETDDNYLTELVSAIDAIDAPAYSSIYLALFAKYINVGSTSDILDKLNTLFSSCISTDLKTYIEDLLIPKFEVSLQLPKVALEFPSSMLTPVDTTNSSVSALTVNIGSLSYSSQNGLQFTNDTYADFTKSKIGNTGMIVDFKKAKLDLSTTSNIAEATAAKYSNDFVGVYVETAEITLPPALFSSIAKTSGQTLGIIGSNLLLGTGGISGTFGLAVVDASGNPTTEKVTEEFEFNLGGTSGFKIGFQSFNITLHQGEFVSTDIKGSLTLPSTLKDASGAAVKITFTLDFEKDGDFKITAAETNGINTSIPNVVNILLKTISVGKENDKFFITASGSLDFSPIKIAGSTLFPTAINLDKLKIWEDGTIELKDFDGSFKLTKPESLTLGPVKLTVTALHFGTYERYLGGQLRKYWFFGFDGGININPLGIDARGDGIKVYFTVDKGTLDIFFRIQSINVDLIIPGSATKESASVLINGYLSMKDNSTDDTASGNNTHSAGSEYIGGISLTLPKIGLSATAGMRLKPSVPAFLIDVSLSLPMCIPLGTTGLGIYGFRGLLGQKYVASKTAAGIGENEPWYQYYKAKVSPDYKQGIQPSKFDPENGFSLGAGVSLATSFDNGKVFSAKIFFLLSLPDVFLLEGQANILSQRIDLDTTNDPPFYAMIAIDSKHVEAALGINLQLPSDSGSIASLSGLMEMAFFYGNAGGWYLNVGRDTPAEKRVTARIFTLFNAYFYFMISKQGIKAGAGASWDFTRRLGPVRVSAGAYIDVAGRISFKPVQIGGSIALGGYASIKVWRFGFGISLDAGLSAEAPHPFILSGYIACSFRLCWPFKRIRFTLDFTWTFNKDIDATPIQLLDGASVKAVNIMSGETFNLCSYTTTSSTELDSYVIPVDSYIDIEFLKGVALAPSSNGCLSRFTSFEQNCEFAELVPPQRGKSPQMLHSFYLNNISIYSLSASNSWETYDVYAALTPMVDLYQKYETILTSDTSALSFGWWQSNDPGKNNKLRMLARTSLSYMGNADNLTPEEFGYANNYWACAGTLSYGTFVNFTNANTTLFPAGGTVVHENIIFVVTDANGTVSTFTNHFGLTKALTTTSKIEIYFPESYPQVNLYLACNTASVVITSYTRTLLSTRGFNDLPQYEYTQIEQVTKTQAELVDGVALNYVADGATEAQLKYPLQNPIVKVVIQPVGTTAVQGMLEEEDTALLLQETTGDILLEEVDIYQNQVQLFEINMISLYDYQGNITWQSQTKKDATGNALKTGFEKYLQPIWRPDTVYRIQITATDEVTGEGYSGGSPQVYNYCFKTAGPIGHFHRYLEHVGNSDVVKYHPSYSALVANATQSQFKLSMLKDYIDMDRSYPNADGRLTNAKPMFYASPELNLFYKYDYVYTMFSGYAAYQNRGAVASTMQIIFKDPTENTATGGSKVGTVSWVQDGDCNQTKEVNRINSSINNNADWESQCTFISKIHKISFSQKVTVDGGLDPDKLYTAQINAVYQGINTASDTAEIHSFTFKTSRYGTFNAQIQSFYSNSPTKAVGNVFSLEKAFSASALTAVVGVVGGAKTGALVDQYASPYDRIVTGALQLGSLPAVQTTEATLIKNVTTTVGVFGEKITTKTIVGILVRNPEPFNDPKIADDALTSNRAIAMEYSGDSPTNTFSVIYSSDRTAAFITRVTNATLYVESSTDYDITFKYIQYDGKKYSVSTGVSPETITLSV